jgi:lipopolysaccharide export system permease protein
LIIDRYIAREIVKPTVVICIILVFIYGCYIATRFLADAVDGRLPGITVILLVLLRVAIALEVLLPITLYLSVVVALGRLYKDSEMTALFACGVSAARVVRPVFFVSLAVAVIVSTLSLFIRPWAYDRYFRLKAQAQATFDLTRMKGGNFYEMENGNRIIFADAVDHQRKQAHRIFIQTERGNSLQVIYALLASQHSDRATGKEILVFQDGCLYEFSRLGNEGRMLQFEHSAMPLEPKEDVQRKFKIKAVPTVHLAGSNKREEIAEFQWRLTTPLSTILLALLGVPLSRSSPRRGKYARLTTAVLIFAVYYNLGAMAKKWVEQGVLNPVPGIWWVQMLLAGLLLMLLWQPFRVVRWRAR